MAGNMTAVLVAFTLFMGTVEGVMVFFGWALDYFSSVGN